MREIIQFNDNWLFTKSDVEVITEEVNYDTVNVPHTWNNLDGQDGGGDYYRGRCLYQKSFMIAKKPKNKKMYIQFDGVNHIADVYCNGVFVGQHKGGFSRFNFDITDYINNGENIISVKVNNSENTNVYPQHADFTFFGGIYRDVRLIWLNDNHFSMDISGADGVFITPEHDGNVRIDAFINRDEKVDVLLIDNDGLTVAKGSSYSKDNHAVVQLKIDSAHLWNGIKDPYMYTAKVMIEGFDELQIRFGIRDFSVDSKKGFILNNSEYPLRGVCRHQDREDLGWALSKKEHNEDVELIKEVGATSVRLAHYQHSQEFYDLCDDNGLVVWAEIPFISVFINTLEAKENTLLQMRELILQNYNHPSICFWGISNEISVGGETPDLENNLLDLNNLSKKLDPTRLTTIANMSMTPFDSRHNEITDVIGYNHYFGWYGGNLDDNGIWFDKFHEHHPDRPIALSEYGAEGLLNLHTDSPKVKDYTEEYHAFYHENLLKTFETRPYLWGTYLWNMFDFAADSRDEGGCKGRNNKGLITFDRKTKKDAFYLYKAYWTTDPFIHLSGKRYVDRPGELSNFKVYSNCNEVTLFVNDVKVQSITGTKIFVFEDVKLHEGLNKITVVSSKLKDEAFFNRVKDPNLLYSLPKEDNNPSDGVVNWFKDLLPENREMAYPKGYYSVKDTIEVLLGNPNTESILKELLIDPLSMDSNEENKGSSTEILDRALAVPLETLWGFIEKKFPEHALLFINERLNEVKK